MGADPLVQIREARPEVARAADWEARLDRLRGLVRAMESVVVAYSGGVDSSLLLAVAVEELGGRAVGVIGRSDSYARIELEQALAQAEVMGARVEIVPTGEISDSRFRSNPVDRCYYCKSELYRRLGEVAARIGARYVIDGTIADDVADWRPGRLAAAELGVRSPLLEAGFSKREVRLAAGSLGLASRDKPASPCLASRIPYGMEITMKILGQVERAEQIVRDLGFREFRVRHHGDLARVEVALPEMGRLLESGLREALVGGLREAGYRFVTVDLEGLRSGSLGHPGSARGPRRSGTA